MSTRNRSGGDDACQMPPPPYNVEVVDLELDANDTGPLGLTFPGDDADGGCSSQWVLWSVREDGLAAGRVRVGDELIEVNNRLVEQTPREDVIDMLKDRPLSLVFIRRQGRGSATPAPQALEVSLEGSPLLDTSQNGLEPSSSSLVEQEPRSLAANVRVKSSSAKIDRGVMSDRGSEANIDWCNTSVGFAGMQGEGERLAFHPRSEASAWLDPQNKVEVVQASTAVFSSQGLCDPSEVVEDHIEVHIAAPDEVAAIPCRARGVQNSSAVRNAPPPAVSWRVWKKNGAGGGSASGGGAGGNNMVAAADEAPHPASGPTTQRSAAPRRLASGCLAGAARAAPCTTNPRRSMARLPLVPNALEEKEQEILSWIFMYDICFIEAATGMGKSTLIPQFVIDCDREHIVWQLQPRRLAAKRLAEFVAGTRSHSEGLGGEVGYRVRGDQWTCEDTRLVYMTTGYFLHFVLHHLPVLRREERRGVAGSSLDSNLNVRGWCTHLFIDEVHEASEETELVLLLCKMLGQWGSLPFKVVVLSATLDFETLHNYFAKSPTHPQPEAEDKSGETAVTNTGALSQPQEQQQRLQQQNQQSASPLHSIGSPDTAAGRPMLPTEPPALSEEPALEPVPDQMITILTSDKSLGLKFRPETWEVIAITKNSCGCGRIRVGDRLAEVNGRAFGKQGDEEVHSLLLSSRPIRLTFLRMSPTSPPKVAPSSLALSEQTPFPLEIKYLDELGEIGDLGDVGSIHFNTEKHKQGFGPDALLLELCSALLVRECRSPSCCALVFLPGISEIEHFAKILDKKVREVRSSPGLDVVVLHSITLAETCEVKRPENPTMPTAYLASSIAETSITLPELTTVFDFGLSRGSVFDPVLEMEQLTTRISSKTSGRQRAGRAGRTKPGQVFRLYPRKVWESMPNNDSWGGSGVQRSLESTVLLVTKTLVRFLGMDIRECLGLLVQPPSKADINGALARLEELDALLPNSSGQPHLTAFGEFAVCIAVLGPRLARLVYCGLMFEYLRPCVVLAAVHAVCGKIDIFSIPPDMKRVAKEEEPDPVERMDEFTLNDRDERQLGMVFVPFNQCLTGHGWQISRAVPGSWAERCGLGEHDEVHMVNGIKLDEVSEQEAIEALHTRPVTLRVRRSDEVVLARAAESSVKHDRDSTVWTQKNLSHLISVAKHSTTFDDGFLSEPVICLRVFRSFLCGHLGRELCSMHRLRQIDGVIREVGSKLRSMGTDAGIREHWDARNRHNHWANFGGLRHHRMPSCKQRILQNLYNDELFWTADYERPLSMHPGPAQRHTDYLSGCLACEQLCLLRMVLCTSFPTNFLFASLKPKPQAAQGPPPAAAPPVPPGVELQAGAAALGGVVPGVATGVVPPRPSQVRLAAAPIAPLPPPLTLRGCPPALTAEVIAEQIARTFCIDSPSVVAAEGQPPGNFVLSFPRIDMQQACNGLSKLVEYSDAAVVNMVIQRDVRHRLQLFDVASPGLGSVQACGELHLTPVLEWRLLRAPLMTVKPAPKMTPLSRIGPVPGIGPALPASGPGAEGHRIAIAMELEASRLNVRMGRSYRAGRAIRSWLVSWLPNVDALDLVSLLVFWPREMTLQEDLTVAKDGSTAYLSITLGSGLAIRFQDGKPLPVDAFRDLISMHCEVRRVFRTGSMFADRLPSLARLRGWGRMFLGAATVTTEVPASCSQASAYTHRHGFGHLRFSEVPSEASTPSALTEGSAAGTPSPPAPPPPPPPQPPPPPATAVARAAAAVVAMAAAAGAPAAPLAEGTDGNFSQMPRGAKHLRDVHRAEGGSTKKPWMNAWRAAAANAALCESQACEDGSEVPWSVECVVERPSVSSTFGAANAPSPSLGAFLATSTIDDSGHLPRGAVPTTAIAAEAVSPPYGVTVLEAS